MGTHLSKVFDAFLAKIEEDEWMKTEYWNEVELDWMQLLNAAIMQFRYSRVPLEYDDKTQQFYNQLSNDEIQILAYLMKLGWTERCVSTWDNLRQLYSDKDFSQANFLDKLNKTQTELEGRCKVLLDKYNRSSNYKPSPIFSKLAGK